MTNTIAKTVSPHSRTSDSNLDFIEVRNLSVKFGNRLAVDNVSFRVGKGEQLSLLGPSGCGKTTLLRCIAGFETPSEGEISIAGQLLFSSSQGINVPVEKRGLSMMFQSYAIWPHMNVGENVGYALKVRKMSRDFVRSRVRELLRMVDMETYIDTPSTQLSGGQQQRVALARSYAYLPHALLLDEPLSNLDARLRDQMREDLAKMQRESGVTTVYVTHDQEEAMSLSDRVIVLSDGRILQEGSPLEIYNKPRNRFVADFIGAANILSGEATPTSNESSLRVGDAVLECDVSKNALKPGAQKVAIRTVYPRLLRTSPQGHINVWPARITGRTFLGDAVVFTVSWPGGDGFRVRTFPDKDFEVGEEVYLQIASKHIVILELGQE